MGVCRWVLENMRRGEREKDFVREGGILLFMFRKRS
jgi:hypothetical protein